MTFILSTVVWTVAILFVTIGVQALAGDVHNGVKWGLGARDTSKEPTVFMGRAQRTVNNHIEGMLLFVPLAIVAELSNIDSNLALKGAGLYIIARVIYPLTYWTGLPVVRSLVWFASLGGTIMLFIAIVTA